MDFILGNPGVLVVTLLLAVATVVLSIFGFIMNAQGLSLRPIAWFAAVFLAIVIPQGIGHIYRALNPASAAGATSGWWNEATDVPHDGAALVPMLGPGAEAAMISDFAPMFSAAGLTPRWARFVIHPDGRTAIIGAFTSNEDAARAVDAWLAMSGLAPYVHGTPTTGFSGARPVGDRIFTRALGRHMLVWTAPDFSGLKAMVAAGGVPHAVHEGMVPEQDDFVVEPPPFGLSWPAAIAGLVGYTLLVSVLFVKGAAWASALPPENTQVRSLEALRSSLIAVGSAGVPFSVVERKSGNGDEIEVEWRYADARWFDLMRAHGIRRVHRLVLRLDEATKSVYVLEYDSAFDASAGVGGAALRYSFSTGINFMQIEHQRVFGIQIGSDGRPTGALDHEWNFNLQEMKAPLQDVVRKSGWAWRPVLWDAPPALRWFFS